MKLIYACKYPDIFTYKVTEVKNLIDEYTIKLKLMLTYIILIYTHSERDEMNETNDGFIDVFHTYAQSYELLFFQRYERMHRTHTDTYARVSFN